MAEHALIVPAGLDRARESLELRLGDVRRLEPPPRLLHLLRERGDGGARDRGDVFRDDDGRFRLRLRSRVVILGALRFGERGVTAVRADAVETIAGTIKACSAIAR